MSKITIQSNGDNSFRILKSEWTEYEVKAKNFEIQKVYTTQDEYKVRANQVYTKEVLFWEPIKNIEVDGTTYDNYEDLSEALTPILFKKGGGSGGGGTIDQDNIPNFIDVTMSDIGAEESDTEDEIKQKLANWILQNPNIEIGEKELIYFDLHREGDDNSNSITLEQARQNGNILEGEVVFGLKDEQPIVKINNKIISFSDPSGFTSGIGIGNNHILIDGVGSDGPFAGFAGSSNYSDNDPTNRLIYTQRAYVDKLNSYLLNEIATGGTHNGKPTYRNRIQGNFINDIGESINLDDLNIRKVIHLDTLFYRSDGISCYKQEQIARVNKSTTTINGGNTNFWQLFTNVEAHIENDTVSTYLYISHYVEKIDLAGSLGIEVSNINDNSYLITLEYTKTTD